MKGKNDKFMSSVKVGQKGQIVIPKEIRDMFDIKPGDTLLMLADAKKGIAIERLKIFSRIADMIFEGRGKEMYPDYDESETKEFAKTIKSIEEDKNGCD